MDSLIEINVPKIKKRGIVSVTRSTNRGSRIAHSRKNEQQRSPRQYERQYESIAYNHTQWAFIVALFRLEFEICEISICQNKALDKRLSM